MQRPPIGVIVDNRRLTRWQANALRTISGKYELLLYNCTNTKAAPRRFRHALYYLLNLLTVRNPLTRLVPFPSELRVSSEVNFESADEGNWQILPERLLDRIADDRPAAIVKFGMGLLRVPPPERLATPILSYHHGDPRGFRGRPAGFYEILEDADCMGQVVQVLGNELDAGAVAAFAETRIHRHSYRATLVEAFRVSPLLLDRAIEKVLAGETAAFPPGRTYRLPSNVSVIAFWAKLIRNLIRRAHYGAFVEKRWQVASAADTGDQPASSLSHLPRMEDWRVVPMPSGFRFIADPFFHPGGEGILVEGMSNSSGRGEIVQLHHGDVRRLTPGPGHWSYPATITADAEHFVVPEAVERRPVQLFRLTADGLEAVPGFSVDGGPRLLDPTIVRWQGRLYLFGNRLEEGAGVLRLWSSETLTGKFAEHPCSPVRISPEGSRMAGNILVRGQSLWRFGQDLSRDYGDGVILFEIQQLSADAYSEAEWSRLKFAEVRGPHTINFDRGRILFDFYRNHASPVAGLRRLKARLGLRASRAS